MWGVMRSIGSARTRSVRDLKGKTVWAGAVQNDGPHIFFSSIVAYVGLDPRTDVKYAWVDKDEAIRLFQDGKIDAFMSFPPGAHELMHRAWVISWSTPMLTSRGPSTSAAW